MLGHDALPVGVQALLHDSVVVVHVNGSRLEDSLREYECEWIGLKYRTIPNGLLGAAARLPRCNSKAWTDVRPLW